MRTRLRACNTVGWLGRGRGGRAEDGREESICCSCIRFEPNFHPPKILDIFNYFVGKCRDEEAISGTDHSPLKVIPLSLKGQ